MLKVMFRMLGGLLLIVTIGLASCQALLKAAPVAGESLSGVSFAGSTSVSGEIRD